MTKSETLTIAAVICCAGALTGFALSSLKNTKIELDKAGRSYDKLIMIAACSSKCHEHGGILVFEAPDYCIPKKVLGLEYSSKCTTLTTCRCKNTEYFVECNMTSETQKTCKSEDGSVREYNIDP